MSRITLAPKPGKLRKKHKIFLSYRRSDGADVSGRVYDRLVAKFGPRNVIKDVYSIPPGVDFREFITGTIPQCSVFLAIIGPDWLTGRPGAPRSLKNPADVVRLELACAYANGIPIMPVLVGGARLPSARSLPKELKGLAGLHAIVLRGDPDFHRDVDRLLPHL